MNRKSFVFISILTLLLFSLQTQAYQTFCTSLPRTMFAGYMQYQGNNKGKIINMPFNDEQLLGFGDISCLTLKPNPPFQTMELHFNVSLGRTATCTTKDGKTKDFDTTKPGTLNFHVWGTSLFPVCQVVDKL